MASDVGARLDGLTARFGLDGASRDRLAAFLDLLERDPHAPSAVTSAAAAVDTHVADALVALDVREVRDARSLADIGSGAGVPGLVLAIALPDAHVRLVESRRRSSAFLGSAVQRLGLANVDVANARVEEWSAGTGIADVVTARALAPPAVVLEYASPLLRLGGLLVDWRGRRDASEEEAAASAAGQLGMERIEVRAVEPFRHATHRHLHLYRKQGETPARFPRRPGIARKRPLGSS